MIKFRIDGLSLKEFYKLSNNAKKEYVASLKQIPIDERSFCDDHILRFFDKDIEEEKVNFFKIA